MYLQSSNNPDSSFDMSKECHKHFHIKGSNYTFDKYTCIYLNQNYNDLMFVSHTSYHHQHIRILNLILEERSVQRLSMAIKVYTHVDAYHHKYKI